MCRSQQVNEITENTESSEEKCNLIQTFDSCEQFEVMAIEQNDSQREMVNRYIEEKVKGNRVSETGIKETRNEKKMTFREIQHQEG